MKRSVLDIFCRELELQLDSNIKELTEYIFEFHEIWTTICEISNLIFDCERCDYFNVIKKFDSLNQNEIWNDSELPKEVRILKYMILRHINIMYNLPSNLQVTIVNGEIYINYKCLQYSLEAVDIEHTIKHLSLCADFDYYLNSHLINTTNKHGANGIAYYTNKFVIIFNLRYALIQEIDGNNKLSFEIDEHVIDVVCDYVNRHYPNYIRSFVMKFED